MQARGHRSTAKELEPGWWKEEKVKILRYREVGEKVEKLSHQFLLSSLHSCSTSENLKVFSALYFWGITTKLSYRESHK